MNKIVLYVAISADGFITDDHDETPWSDAEWSSFQDFVRSCDLCLVGRRTYELMRESNEFVVGVNYVVVTNDQAADTGQYPKLAINSVTDIPKANTIGVIGGGELNGSMAKLGAINEVILDVEPVVLGQGKRLFGHHDIHLNLRLLTTKPIGPSTIQNHYMVEG